VPLLKKRWPDDASYRGSYLFPNICLQVWGRFVGQVRLVELSRVSTFPKLRSANMADKGHSRRFDRITATSGLPRRTDILRIGGHVSKVPDSDV
jgi:hypothetical protein